MNTLAIRKSTPLERGDLRVLVLSMLKTPMHGYHIMCQFKEHSHGGYMPSTGALYPQLRGLEEDGLIRSEDCEGKKKYAITKKGEEYLRQNGKLVRQASERFKEFWGENDLDELVAKMKSMAGILMDGAGKTLESGKESDSRKIEKSKLVLSRAEEELKGIWK